MLVHLVALLATLFIIFGLAYARSSNDWLRSSNGYPLFLYGGPTSIVTNERPIAREHSSNDLSARRSTTDVRERGEDEAARVKIWKDQRVERSAEEVRDGGSGWRSLGSVRRSLDHIQDENDRDIGVPVTRTLQPVSVDNATRKQEGNRESILQSFKTTIQKTAVIPSTRLNTSQIYNLILKETLKETAVQRKTENEKNEPDGSSTTTTDNAVSSTKENESSSQAEDGTRSNPSRYVDEEISG